MFSDLLSNHPPFTAPHIHTQLHRDHSSPLYQSKPTWLGCRHLQGWWCDIAMVPVPPCNNFFWINVSSPSLESLLVVCCLVDRTGWYHCCPSWDLLSPSQRHGHPVFTHPSSAGGRGLPSVCLNGEQPPLLGASLYTETKSATCLFHTCRPSEAKQTDLVPFPGNKYSIITFLPWNLSRFSSPG